MLMRDRYLLYHSFVADVYLNMGNTEEASNCVQEASAVFPLSPDALYMVNIVIHVVIVLYYFK